MSKKDTSVKDWKERLILELDEREREYLDWFIQQEIDRAREEGKNWTNYQRGWDNALRAVGKFTKEHTSKLTK